MDPLSEILKSLKIRHTSIGRMSLTAPWGLRVEGIGGPAAHAVASETECWMRLPNQAAVRLRRGDLVLQTGSCAVELMSSPDVLVEDVGRAWNANGLPPFDPGSEPAAPLHLRWGGGGAATGLLGVAFGLASERRNPLLDALPESIVLRQGEGDSFRWIGPTVDFLSATGADSPGFAAMARLLAELIFVNTIRSHLLQGPTRMRGWLRGLADPGLARALQVLHAQPGADWTVESLARAAGLSRTAFATRFAEAVGVSPIQYLTRWRMHLAAERILSVRPNLTQLAFELGYASDAAFRDAFKRHHGVPPSRYGNAPAEGADAADAADVAGS